MYVIIFGIHIIFFHSHNDINDQTKNFDFFFLRNTFILVFGYTGMWNKI